MHGAAVERLTSELRRRGLTAALITNPATLTWLSGYAAPIQFGPSPFGGGPALGWLRDGELTLLVSDLEAPAARASGLEVREYRGYTIDEPLDPCGKLMWALDALLREQAPPRGDVGIEWDYLPAWLTWPLLEMLSQVRKSPLEGECEALRAVKSAEEQAKLRAALRLCDLGQQAVREDSAKRAGHSELELWVAAKGRMELEAGTRLPVVADLVAGAARTAELGGPPSTYVLQEGDPVIFDVAPRLDGYWGDTCGTWFVGEPSAELRRAFGTVREALVKGLEAVRPGVPARELDALLREHLAASGYQPHPHHSGHGLGTTYHEEPRLVPYNDMALEPGMVITLEPGVYPAGVGGVRLEEVVMVTSDGCERLTHHLDGV